MVKRLRCCDIVAVAKAIELLDTEARFDIDEDVFLTTIRVLRDVIPRDFTFNILPSLTKSSSLLQRKITAIDPQASVKRSSLRLGNGYTLTLTSVALGKRGPRPDGVATSIFRQALRVRLIQITAHPTGDNEDVRPSNRS